VDSSYPGPWHFWVLVWHTQRGFVVVIEFLKNLLGGLVHAWRATNKNVIAAVVESWWLEELA